MTALVGFLSASCGGPAIPTAPHRSPHFEPVAKNLQLGGTVYAYADIEGDAERAVDFALSLVAGVPGFTKGEAGQRPTATRVVKALGLAEVDAIGMSSYQNGDLYHNRSFVYQTGPREGLFAVLGGAAKPFHLPNSASADTDLVWEHQLDVDAFLSVVRALGAVGLGPRGSSIDALMAKLIPGLDLTFGKLLEGLQTTLGVIIAIDETRILKLPGSEFWFSFTDFMLQADGLGELAKAIERRAFFDPFLRSERNGDQLIIGVGLRLPPPWNAYQPTMVQDLESGRIYVVSRPEYLKEHLSAKETVAGTEDFSMAFAALPESGNALLFLSRRMTRELHGLLDRWINAAGVSPTTAAARFLFPKAGLPLGWVASNRPDGALFTSNSPSSHKSTLVTLGLGAALPMVVTAATANAELAPPAPNTIPFQ